jgi:hypothetical protein
MNQTNSLQTKIRASRSFIFLRSKFLRNCTNPLEGRDNLLYVARETSVLRTFGYMAAFAPNLPPPPSHILVNADIPCFLMKDAFVVKHLLKYNSRPSYMLHFEFNFNFK